MSSFTKTSLLAPGEPVIANDPDQLSGELQRLTRQRSATLLNRRHLIAGLGAAGAVAGAAALTGCNDSGTLSPTPAPTPPTTPPTTPPPATPSVVDVLNFALNLEYLEASFYAYVTTGSGLNTGITGASPGAVSGGAQVQFTNGVIGAYAKELAMHEAAHVTYLRNTITSLMGTPIDIPALNLAAMGSVTSDSTFVIAARQLETVGVSAYEGSIAALVSNLSVLTAAAQIHDVESEHESVLRQFCIQFGYTSPAVDSSDIPPTATAVFNTSSTTGLYSAPRTTSQVLGIVYGKAGQTGIASGGFFPNGLNGNIKTS